MNEDSSDKDLYDILEEVRESMSEEEKDRQATIQDGFCPDCGKELEYEIRLDGDYKWVECPDCDNHLNPNKGRTPSWV